MVQMKKEEIIERKYSNQLLLHHLMLQYDDKEEKDVYEEK